MQENGTTRTPAADGTSIIQSASRGKHRRGGLVERSSINKERSARCNLRQDSPSIVVGYRSSLLLIAFTGNYLSKKRSSRQLITCTKSETSRDQYAVSSLISYFLESDNYAAEIAAVSLARHFPNRTNTCRVVTYYAQRRLDLPIKIRWTKDKQRSRRNKDRSTKDKKSRGS